MSERTPEAPKHRSSFFTLLGGVVLPSVSILVEATTHVCAEQFFDPIPTLWHVLLVALVPLAHLQVWLAVRKGRAERAALLGAANALAVGVSLFYTVVYLPLLPLGFVALFFAGLGLLPMAPLFALISGLILRRQLRRVAPDSSAVRRPGLAAGVLAALALVAAVEIPATLTRVGLRMASSDSETQRDEGVRWLRAYGDEDYLLRACYEQSGRATDLVGFLFSLGDTVTPDEARQIYYRVTGETFNARVPPERRGGRFTPRDTFDFDPDQGGEVIAGKVKGLSLAGSRVDGSMDAGAGVAYLEWTLLFKNTSAWQQEARAHVRLPPGGVVSRLTLWVNGEEREAAFAGRGQTRQAYQQVVSLRRDPVLVTTAGRDRILVQCFPVPPNGGEMRVRFGVTAPLALEDRANAALRLPHLLERNFGIPDQTAHAVWVESARSLRAEGGKLSISQPSPTLYAVRGELRDAELSAPAATIRAERTEGADLARTRDALGGDGEIVNQIVGERETPAAPRVVLVVDTSRRAGRWAAEVAAAVRTLPSETDVRLLLAGGNGLYTGGGHVSPPADGPAEIARRLEETYFEGGADNVAALIRAWDLAAEAGGGAVVWVHGPQPVLLKPVEELRQRWERRPDGPTLYDVPTEAGPDRIAEELDGVTAIETIARAGGLQADLTSLFARLSGRAKTFQFFRLRGEVPHPSAPVRDTETSSHLARLWANDEVNRLLADRTKNRTEEAVKLAARYQLVTPVSGAVVLETQEQYKQAGLQPVEPGTVPTIPEPEMVLLLLVVATVFLFMLFRRRLRPGRQGETI